LAQPLKAETGMFLMQRSTHAGVKKQKTKQAKKPEIGSREVTIKRLNKYLHYLTKQKDFL
jgi:hypothetical protein